jgi:hypothetical protein
MRCPYCGESDVGDTSDEAWDNHIGDCESREAKLRGP